MSAPARLLALVVSLTAFAALVAQGVVAAALPELDSIPAILWRLAGYFTVLTNLLVALAFAGIAAGRVPSRNVLAGLTLSIIVVGLTYHALLADLWQPEGLAWWADQGLHSATPVAVTLWWAAFAPKRGVALADVPGWLLWPLIYCGYAVIRGTLTGFWPYPFLDANALGAARVAVNSAGMIAACAVVGMGLVGFARLTR